MNSKSEKIFKAIHTALHKDIKGLRIGGKPYYVQVAKNDCRYIKYDNKIFIQQDSRRKGALASRAKAGEQLTRIVRSGKPWGWISNKEIFDPLNGE